MKRLYHENQVKRTEWDEEAQKVIKVAKDPRNLVILSAYDQRRATHERIKEFNKNKLKRNIIDATLYKNNKRAPLQVKT